MKGGHERSDPVAVIVPARTHPQPGYAGNSTPKDRVKARHPNSFCKKDGMFFKVFAEPGGRAIGTSNAEAWLTASRS